VSVLTLLAAAPGPITPTANTFTAPHVEYRALMPMLVVFGAATLGILVEAFLPRAQRYWAQVGLSLAGVIVALGFVIANHGMAETAAADAVSMDGVTLFLQGTILALAVLAVLLVAERGTAAVDLDAFAAQAASAPGSGGERAAEAAGLRSTEVFPLMLFSIGGMLLFPAANDLLTSFVALEVLSLPLYLLCGLARRRRLLSQEAAMKYFLLGAFSSAFFLYGIAMLYGYAGSVRLSEIATAISAAPHSDVLLLAGIALLAVGLLFKVGAVPFHAWTPDVYQGAPTPITGFMAASTKVAAFGALLRVAYVALPGMRWDWRPVLWGVAILTMLAGAGALAAGAGAVPSTEPPPRPEDRLEGLEPELEHVDASRKPGGWQSAYWNQRKAAEVDKQSFDLSAMARSIDILGPVELAGTAATAGSRAADLAEVAAFIMLHPGCSAAQIAAELWPGRKGAATIRDAQVSRLREWLGTDAYGEQHLRITPHGYALGPSVSCDWLEFVRRVQAGELVSALALVRGRPFEDAPLRRYGWAEALRHEMTALVIDTAHYVAEACLREQNPRGAQNAAYRGLQAAPESELLYRDLLTALAALGDLSGARQHADTLIAYADREGIDLQSETTALLRDVLQAVPGV